MKNYFTHMSTKSAHERRTHAMQVAGIVTALVFVVWISTLGIRFASTTPPQTADSDTASQLANVASAESNGQATLIVATTTTQ